MEATGRGMPKDGRSWQAGNQSARPGGRSSGGRRSSGRRCWRWWARHERFQPRPTHESLSDLQGLRQLERHADLEADPFLEQLTAFQALSNDWVVSGLFTKNGKPLLANDPHLSFTAPEGMMPMNSLITRTACVLALFSVLLGGCVDKGSNRPRPDDPPPQAPSASWLSNSSAISILVPDVMLMNGPGPAAERS